MSGRKYDGGETPAVGDFLRFDRDDDYWSVTRVTPDYVFATGENSEKEQAIHAPAFKLVRRADGSPPRAGDGAEDGRPVIGKDREGREMRKGDRVRCGCGSIAEFECPERSTDEAHGPMGVIVDHLHLGLKVFCEASGRYVDPKFAVLITDAAPTEPAPPPVAATEPPLTFPLCPRCHERMTGAECGQPACVQVRKWAAMRSREEQARTQLGMLENVVRLAAEQWPGIAVVTDRVGPKGAHGACLFVELSAKGVTSSFLLGEGSGTSAAANMFRSRAENIQSELGKRALGGGR